jgi:hypothetical protein
MLVAMDRMLQVQITVRVAGDIEIPKRFDQAQ